MAVVSKETIWQGVPIRIDTDMDTGQAKVYLKRSGLFVMQSDRNKGSKWDYTSSGLNEFKREYNRRNPSKKITEKTDFSKEIWGAGGGLTTFNNVRSITINNQDNYSGLDPNDIKERQRIFVQTLGVPGVIDPINQKTATKDGKVIAAPQQTATEKEPTAGSPTGNDDTSKDFSPNYNVIQGVSKQIPEFKGGGDLRYPLGAPPTGFPFDFIRIAAVKYVPSGLDYIDTNTSNPGAVSRYETESEVTSVILPMQPNLSESHSVGWGGDSLDPFRAALAGAAMGGIQNLKDGDFLKAVQAIGSDIAKGALAFASDPNTIDFVAAYFAGQAVGANVNGRLTGQVINPNMELLFSGPTLRTFNFNFRMTPRSDTEAEMVKKIIRSFKMNMAVQRSDTNLFLRTPNIFKLKYISGDGSDATQQHPFLNKFKPCAMTSFNVNYTPDGSYMTFENKSLTAYDMSMSFSELEPIYQDDYAEGLNVHADMGF